MATEVAFCSFNKGHDPSDSTSAAGQALKECLEELSRVAGFQRCYWGKELENPDRFRLFVDWDAVESHKKFQESEQYGPFTERLGSFMDFSTLTLYHVHFEPHPPSAALSDVTSPATEILTVYFPSSITQADQDEFLERLKKLVSVIETSAPAYRGSAGGWSAEDDVPVPSDGSGSAQKGKVFLAVIGWDSMEAHMAFRETQTFKENIHLLRDAKNVVHTTVCHASCVEIQKGGGVGDVTDGGNVQEEILNPQQGGKQSVKTAADGTTTKNDPGVGGVGNANKKERSGR